MSLDQVDAVQILDPEDSGFGISLSAMTDTQARNNTIYFSTTAGKAVYKDSGGTVHALY